jgi:hypothetical protein
MHAGQRFIEPLLALPLGEKKPLESSTRRGAATAKRCSEASERLGTWCLRISNAHSSNVLLNLCLQNSGIMKNEKALWRVGLST